MSKIEIQIDDELNLKLEHILKELNISKQEAINLFLNQVVSSQTLPFKIEKDLVINYPTKEELDKISSTSFKKHEIAYKELAK